jgi:hypothetical protein
MGISFYVRFRHLLIVVVFVATIVVFQCYWKTFSLLNVSSFIGNNVTFESNSLQYGFAYEKEEQGLVDLDHEFDSNEGRNSTKGEIFNSSKSFDVDNIENEIQKTLHDDDAQKVASNGSGIQSMEIVSQNAIPRLPNNKSLTSSSTRISKLVWPTTLTQLNSQLFQSFNYSSMVCSLNFVV